MIVSINQPAYLPWLGYFDRIARSDVHVVLDHVQFEKNSMTNRNKIRIRDGWAWLTVPVRTGGRFGDLAIGALEVDSTARWSKKHAQALRSNYAKAPFFAEHFPFFEDVYVREWPLLAPLLREITIYMLRAFGIETKIVYSGDLGISTAKEALVLDICRALKATAYVSGPFGRDYLDPAAFEKENIGLYFHDYAHPEYRQAFAGFEPYMSAIDLLFNHGPDSLRILKGA